MSDVVTPLKKSDNPDVILVTGATGGLGSALCRSLTLQGTTVILSGRDLSALEKLYDELDDLGTAEPALYPINLAGAKAEDYQTLAATLSTEYGKLNGIAHCAADAGIPTPLDKYPSDTWQTVMTTNANSAFMLCKACLSLMMRTQNASITFTIDHRDTAFWGAYGVSKAALVSLMRILADETEGFRDEYDNPKVAVNAVHPGRMRTSLRAIAFSGELPEESPAPATRVPDFMRVLMRNDPKLTGQIIYLDDADRERWEPAKTNL